MDNQIPPSLIDPKDRFIVLTIVYNAVAKRVGVQGNLSDKPFCIGMLASAIHAVLAFRGEDEKKIVVPEIIPPKGIVNG